MWVWPLSTTCSMLFVSCGFSHVTLARDGSTPSGGHDGNSYLNSVECYEPKTNQWSTRVAPTGYCRTSVGVAVLDGHIYAVGGQDGLSCLSIVER